MIDLNIIERGDNYNTLKKSVIIFICLHDPFDKGLHIYTFENKCKEAPDLLLGDESMKVFINAAGTANDISDEMSEFLRYLREGAGNTQLVERIDTAVRKARQHVEWRTEYMSLQLKFYDIMDEARDEGLEIGKEIGKEIQLFELVKDNLLSIDNAYIRTKLTKEEFILKMNEYFENK